MREFISQIIIFWNNYWGESQVMWLFLAAVAFLFVFRRKKKSIKYLLLYTVAALILFFCPISAIIIQKCIGELVYWRVLWLVPVFPVIAVAMTEILKERKGRIAEYFLMFLWVATIALCGKGIFQAGNYKFVHNYQQVPDEVAAICEMVKKDAGDAEFLIAADNFIAPYIRVYDPSIYMLFNRECRGNYGRGAKRLYLEINAPVFNYKNIASVGKSISCNYLVVKNPNEQQKKEMEHYSYQEVGTAGRYTLYRLGDSADAVRSSVLDEWNWK